MNTSDNNNGQEHKHLIDELRERVATLEAYWISDSSQERLNVVENRQGRLEDNVSVVIERTDSIEEKCVILSRMLDKALGRIAALELDAATAAARTRADARFVLRWLDVFARVAESQQELEASDLQELFARLRTMALRMAHPPIAEA